MDHSIPSKRLALPMSPTGPADEQGWTEEVLRYAVGPLPRPKFKSMMDAHALFSGGRMRVRTRVCEPRQGEPCLELFVEAELRDARIEGSYTCTWDRGLKAGRLQRQTWDLAGQLVRSEDVDFAALPMRPPEASYPDILLPFLLRGQPLDGRRRAAQSWTSDRFCARVYYERRRSLAIDVPAGRFRAVEVWMYPDLNDWIALGGVLTRLAKPLLPRYRIFFEQAPPHRVLRFAGPYGPPGAAEVLLELLGDGPGD